MHIRVRRFIPASGGVDIPDLKRGGEFPKFGSGKLYVSRLPDDEASVG